VSKREGRREKKLSLLFQRLALLLKSTPISPTAFFVNSLRGAIPKNGQVARDLLYLRKSITLMQGRGGFGKGL